MWSQDEEDDDEEDDVGSGNGLRDAANEEDDEDARSPSVLGDDNTFRASCSF